MASAGFGLRHSRGVVVGRSSSSGTNRNRPKPYGRSAPWNGSPSRRKRAEPRRPLRRPYPSQPTVRQGRQRSSPWPGDRGIESISLQCRDRVRPKSSRTSLHLQHEYSDTAPALSRDARARPGKRVAPWYSAGAAKLGEQIGKLERAMRRTIRFFRSLGCAGATLLNAVGPTGH